MNGTLLREVIEFMHGNETKRGFLQGAGIRYGRDTDTRQIFTIEVLDPATRSWETLQDDASYFVIVNNFIADGGDGFTMFKDIPRYQASNKLSMMQDSQLFQEYIQANTPVRFYCVCDV